MVSQAHKGLLFMKKMNETVREYITGTIVLALAALAFFGMAFMVPAMVGMQAGGDPLIVEVFTAPFQVLFGFVGVCCLAVVVERLVGLRLIIKLNGGFWRAQQ